MRARFGIGPTTDWEARRQRSRAMHDYRGSSSKAKDEIPGRKKRRWRRIVHSARSLPCGDDPSRDPTGTGTILHPASTRTDVSRETSVRGRERRDARAGAKGRAGGSGTRGAGSIDAHMGRETRGAGGSEDVSVKHLCALVRKRPSTFHNVPPAWSGASAGFQKPFSACRRVDDCDIFDQGVAVRERG